MVSNVISCFSWVFDGFNGVSRLFHRFSWYLDAFLIMMMTLISWTAKQRLNLTFIHSWRVLSAPTGPIQALNPNWIFTKEENHRGQSTLPFSSQAWPSDSFLHLAPSPLLNKNNALPGFFSGGWKLAHRMVILANPQGADKFLEPWNGATSSCWSSWWWATPLIKGLAYRCVFISCPG